MKKTLLLLTLILNLVLPTTILANNANEDPQRFTRTILPEVNKDIVKSNADCRLVITRFEDKYFSSEIPTPDEAATDTAPDPANEEESEADTAPQPADYGSIKRFYESIELLKAKEKDAFTGLNYSELTANDILGCAIVTGRIKMFYLSMILSYALNMLAIVSGSIAMLFIIFGGYQYVIGALTQSTDNAKKTIINAIIGLIVSTGAWIIVNIVLSIISS